MWMVSFACVPLLQLMLFVWKYLSFVSSASAIPSRVGLSAAMRLSSSQVLWRFEMVASMVSVMVLLGVGFGVWVELSAFLVR